MYVDKGWLHYMQGILLECIDFHALTFFHNIICLAQAIRFTSLDAGKPIYRKTPDQNQNEKREGDGVTVLNGVTSLDTKSWPMLIT